MFKFRIILTLIAVFAATAAYAGNVQSALGGIALTRMANG